jgi:hypothetical protein
LNLRVLARGLAERTEENPSPPALFEMATAYWLSQAIYVASKLGIADFLRDGPQSCVALVNSTGSDAPPLFRLMRALSSVGIFAHLGGGRFALSRLAEPLQTDVHGSLRARVITIGEIHYQVCESLLHSVQTGSPAFNSVLGASLFDYLQQNMVVPDTDAMHFSKLLDLNMLAMTGGRERTKAEFHALLDAAGYELTRIIPTIAPQSVIEAVPRVCN